VPPLLVEIGVGALLALTAFALRAALAPVLGNIAPYTFVFVAVTLAAVAAGWRSGLLTLAIGQALVWFGILEPLRERSFENLHPVSGLVVSSICQLIILTIVALYQREVAKGAASREQRVALLDEALREIDHRTRNNYQTVMAMVELQARRSKNRGVQEALRQVADRIQAIAHASQQLAVHSGDIETVRLDAHLCGIVEQIERGLSREEIRVECEVDNVTAAADAATSISIIVNELVTNAIKHAFNGDGSGHVRVTGRSGAEFELIVADDGRGMRPQGGTSTGLRSKLVESFARQLGATHDVTSSDQGTTHRLVIPRLG
jgi:two-component system, sensor histidine kinase PdtaS